MRESVERIEAMDLPGKLSHLVTDRGFDGKNHEAFLAERGIGSMICPKDPARSNAWTKSPCSDKCKRGAAAPKRAWRSSKPLTRASGAPKALSTGPVLGWSVLSHNLARRAREEQDGKRQQARTQERLSAIP